MRTSLLVLVFASVFSACSEISQNDIDIERAKWDASGFDFYSYIFDASCFCAFGYQMPARIFVRNEQVIAVLDPQTGMPRVSQRDTTIVLDSAGLQSALVEAYIMDYFFDVLDQNRNAHSLDVSFHPDYGFPEFIDADPIKNAVDDEFYYEISNFEAYR